MVVFMEKPLSDFKLTLNSVKISETLVFSCFGRHMNFQVCRKKEPTIIDIAKCKFFWQESLNEDQVLINKNLRVVDSAEGSKALDSKQGNPAEHTSTRNFFLGNPLNFVYQSGHEWRRTFF